jgi:hypothetical protein
MNAAKVTLLIMLAMIAATIAAAQTEVFVPGNASGLFGLPVDTRVPLVPAITVSEPAKITVTYVSGTVNFGTGEQVSPNGVPYYWGIYEQTPLQEAIGVSDRGTKNMAALIGVFVPRSTAQRAGFSALDGTKNVTPVGVMPDDLFFIGIGKTFTVRGAGTLFLGINDNGVSDNSGGFEVMVAAE